MMFHSLRRLVLPVTAALALVAFGVGSAAAAPRASGKDEGPSASASPPTAQSQHLHNAAQTGAECPNGLACRVMPAAYQQNNPNDPSDYGNYDLANRPADGLAVRFVVIHDTEVGYDDTIALFQNPFAYVSSHYVLRSADGQVTQMVPTKDVAWHAGNWWVNSHAIGIENEGFALQGNQWYTPQLYRSLARLTRYLADRYGVPLDREHLVGHDQVPGTFGLANQRAMHWDPGPFFDWSHFMGLVGAPITPAGGDRTGRIVTIDPPFATNRPVLTGCDPTCAELPSQPANFVYLRSAPSPDASLIADVALSGTALEPGGVGSTRADDWGDKAVTGQTFAVAERRGDWTAVWYGGQKAWLYDPESRHTTIPGSGTLVTPKAGTSTIPVYGRAYPQSVSTATLPYTIPAGQVYVAKDLVQADYYDAPTFTLNAADHHVVKGTTTFYVISFNHRLAFVKASDVDIVG
jgi:N-acetyl-anhydromuramyl-L-alanine amidase AmpD